MPVMMPVWGVWFLPDRRACWSMLAAVLLLSITALFVGACPSACGCGHLAAASTFLGESTMLVLLRPLASAGERSPSPSSNRAIRSSGTGPVLPHLPGGPCSTPLQAVRAMVDMGAAAALA
jgi:hypothetical protein